MTVLIKGIEMPKNCGECQFCHTENFTTWCCPTEREDICYDAIPEWCPLEEPKTGEWVWSPKDKDGTVSGCCSNCSFSHLFIGGHTAQYNYCPNCGARMKGADNE